MKKMRRLLRRICSKGEQNLSFEDRPRVLDHVFAPIEVDRAGVAIFVTVGVAIDLGRVDEAFAAAFDEDVITANGMKRLGDVDDDVAKIRLMILLSQDVVKFV